MTNRLNRLRSTPSPLHPPSIQFPRPRSCCTALRGVPCVEISIRWATGARSAGSYSARRREGASAAHGVRLLRPSAGPLEPRNTAKELQRSTASASSGQERGALHVTPPKPVRRRRIQAQRLLRPTVQSCTCFLLVDFAQDTQEGGADEFELIPDSDEEGGAKGSSLLDDDDEYVPETEPQDVMVSRINGPCANQGHQSLSAMLHEWKQSISDMENESVKVDMERAKVQMGTVKVEKAIEDTWYTSFWMETKVIRSPNFICSHYILILFMFGWTLVEIKDLLVSLLW